MKTLILALALMLPLTSTFAAEEMDAQVTQIHQLMFRADAGLRGGTLTLGSGVMFDYSLRAGFDVGAIRGFARMVPTVVYHYSSIDYGSFFGAYDATVYELQFKLKDIADTGFYLAPTLGMASVGLAALGQSVTSDRSFAYGIGMGYEFCRTNLLSFGPEFEMVNIRNVGTYSANFGINLNLL